MIVRKVIVFVMYIVLILCPALLAAGAQTLTIDSQLGTSIEDCFERITIGEQLPSHAVYRNVSELTTRECEQICKQDKLCQIFDYGVGAKGNATCNLSKLGDSDLKEAKLLRNPDYDIYTRRILCEQGPPNPLPPQSDEPLPNDGPVHRPVFRPVDDEPRRPEDQHTLADDLRPYDGPGIRPPPTAYSRPYNYRPNYHVNNHLDRPDDYSNQKPDIDQNLGYGAHKPQDIPFPEKPHRPIGPEFERPKPDPYDVLNFQDVHGRPPGPSYWRPDPYFPPSPEDEIHDIYGPKPIRPYRPVRPLEDPDYHYIVRPNRRPMYQSPPRPYDEFGYTPLKPYGDHSDNGYGQPFDGPIGPPSPPYRPGLPFNDYQYPSRPGKPDYSYASQYASGYGQNSHYDQGNSIHLEIHDPPRPYKPPRKPTTERPGYGLDGGYSDQSSGYGQESHNSQNSYTQSHMEIHDPPKPYKPPRKPIPDRPVDSGYGQPSQDGGYNDQSSSSYGQEAYSSHTSQSQNSYTQSTQSQSYGSSHGGGYGQNEDNYTQRPINNRPIKDPLRPLPPVHSSQDSYGSHGSQSYGGQGSQSYGGQGSQSYGGQGSQSYGGQGSQSYGGQGSQSYGGQGSQSYGGQSSQSYGSQNSQSYGSQSYGTQNYDQNSYYGSQRPQKPYKKPSIHTQSNYGGSQFDNDQGFGSQGSYGSSNQGYGQSSFETNPYSTKPSYSGHSDPNYDRPDQAYGNEPEIEDGGYKNNQPKPSTTQKPKPKPDIPGKRPDTDQKRPGTNQRPDINERPSYNQSGFNNGYGRPDIRPVYEYDLDRPVGRPDYVVRPDGQVVTSRPVSISDYGNRRPAVALGRNPGQRVSYKACFRRVLAGKRAVRSHVRRVVPCERLEDCRRECAVEKRFHCESFNYKLDPSFRGKGLCELMTKPIEAFDLQRDFVEDKDFDFFELDRNSLEPDCPETLRGPGMLHSGFLSSRPDNLIAGDHKWDRYDGHYPSGGTPGRNFDRGHDRGYGSRRKQEPYVPYQIGIARSNEDDDSWGQYGGSYGGSKTYYKDRGDFHNSINHWRLSTPKFEDAYLTQDFDYNNLGRGKFEDTDYGYGHWKRGHWNQTDSTGLSYGESNYYRPITPAFREKPDDGPKVNDCSPRRRPGMSLGSGAIRRSVRARNVVACETACFDENEFKCVSYSYRYSSQHGVDNCFLSERPYRGAELSSDSGSDVYAMPSDQGCNVLKPWVESECFWHVRSEAAVSGAPLSVAGLGACEAECIRARDFFCRGFSFRYDAPKIGEELGNCILTSSPPTSLEVGNGLKKIAGYEVYARGNYGRGCEPALYDETHRREKQCYLQYDNAARLLGSAVKGHARVKSEEACGESCTNAPFRCLSFSYNNAAPSNSDNCLMSEVRVFDLQRGVDYEHSTDDWLFAFDLFNAECWRKVHGKSQFDDPTHEVPRPISPPSVDPPRAESGPSGTGYLPSGPVGPDYDRPSGPSYIPGSGPPSGPGYKPSGSNHYGPSGPDYKPEPNPHRPSYLPEPSSPGYISETSFKPGGYLPEVSGFKPGYIPEASGFKPGYIPEASGFKPGYTETSGPGYRPSGSGYKPTGPGNYPGHRPSYRPEYRPSEPDYKPSFVPSGPTGPSYGNRPENGHGPAISGQNAGYPGNRGDEESIIVSWRHYTVSGFPCRGGSACAQNLVGGHWACEPEGGEIGSWDYCCSPNHRCGYSEGFHKPWCYVGQESSQWRPCSEKYYPYHEHNVPHPSQGREPVPRPQQGYGPPQPSYGRPGISSVSNDKRPGHAAGQYLPDADRRYWDNLYKNGPQAYYDRYGNPLPGYARVPTEHRPHIKYQHNYPRPGLGWEPVSPPGPDDALDPPVPGGFGAPRYWPVAYLHKGPPPNMTYFRFNDTDQNTNRNDYQYNRTVILPSKEKTTTEYQPIPVNDKTEENRDKVEARKEKNITDKNVFNNSFIDIKSTTTTTPKIEIKENIKAITESTLKANVSDVDISTIKPETLKATEDFVEKDAVKGIDDKLDDFTGSLEVVDLDPKVGSATTDLRTLEAEEAQIAALGRFIASQRGGKLVLEKRSQKDLEAKNIAIDEHLVDDFNFGNKFPTERKGRIQKVTKDEIERERNIDKSLEVSETTFVRPPRVLSTTDNVRKAMVNGKVFYDATIREQRDLFVPNTTRKLTKNPPVRILDDMKAPSVFNNQTFGKKKNIRARNVNPVRRVRRIYRKRYNPEEVRRRLLERDRTKQDGDSSVKQKS